MNPNRVDFLVDLAYGALLFLSIVLIVTVGTNAGIMFGLGALISYVVHVVWKMSRFDPAWMTEEVTENIEETLTEEVTESVGEQVTEEVTENVEEQVTENFGAEVAESVEEQVTEEVAENVEAQVTEEVAENVEEQVTEEVAESVEEQVTESVEETLSEEIAAIIDQLEEVNERVDRRPRAEEVEEGVGGTADGNEAEADRPNAEPNQHEG